MFKDCNIYSTYMQPNKQQPQYVLHDWDQHKNKKEDTEEITNRFDFVYKNQCSFKATTIDQASKQVVSLGPYDSRKKYLTVYPGFNMKGTCPFEGCVAQNKNVWISKGYGKIEFAQARFQNLCPCCNNEMVSSSFKTFGYRNAKVTFKGGRHLNGKDIKFNWQDVEKNGKFVMFRDDQENICEWNFLNIDVQKI